LFHLRNHSILININSVRPEYFQTQFRTETAFDEWPYSFAIITAYATTGEVWTEEQNQRADERLRKVVIGIDPDARRITGYSPTTGHAEPGWAVSMELAVAKQIGREFLQDAIYFIDNGTIYVAKCDGDDAPIFVDDFLNRLD